MSYQPSQIEPKWQAFWEKNQTFKTEPVSNKPKYYVLDMFPYPSSSGLHVGHPEGYTATDILARYKRSKGFNVLHPMGWDAFGLPAEQYAIKTGVHPAITTNEAIDNFRRQLKMLGFSYDWTREVATCDPKYYHWTQWIFLKLHERGLAFQTEVPVNWCPELKTVLANEEVVDGKSERGGHPVFRMPMKQWMLKITDYAERLLEGLDKLNWPEGTKELQRNWIGKSVGLQLKFKIDGSSDTFEIFTTRPDTLWGVSYMALAPEHPLVAKIATAAQSEAVKKYQLEASQKSEMARQDASKEKTGCFTGAFAINPANGEKVQIWISDYVLMTYGTGAVMAVPAHDERDFEFAKAFSLPIKKVIDHADECFTGEGLAINSGFINGLKTPDAVKAVIAWAEKENLGKATIKYKLRDWLFSRQRYWGEPFPLVKNAAGKIIPLEADALPVVLPDVKSYEPTGTGESPLAGITAWREVKDPKTGETYLRETDTMPGSAGSSWYFLRYCDPHNEKEAFNPEAEKYWMPVDLYLGGDEHAVGHLLYSRFWMKVLFDCGLTTHDEPFQRLVHQGMILGEDGEKMSKSRGNVINPDDVVKKYGADTLRIFEMFLGPLEKDKPWSTTAIEGTFRFLSRAYRLFYVDSELEKDVLKVSDHPMTLDDEKILHVTIKKVTEDIENLRFNTAISSMMVFVNHFTSQEKTPKAAMRAFTQILAPFAPHLCEEFWQALGETKALSHEPWPTYNPELVKADSVTVAVQVLGKLRGTLEVAPGTAQAELEELAKKNEGIARFLEGKQIAKVIYVQNKILNFVVK